MNTPATTRASGAKCQHIFLVALRRGPRIRLHESACAIMDCNVPSERVAQQVFVYVASMNDQRVAVRGVTLRVVTDGERSLPGLVMINGAFSNLPTWPMEMTGHGSVLSRPDLCVSLLNDFVARRLTGT